VTPAKVELDGVSKRYGSVTAVDAVSLSIEPGTLVTLLGPSGCGKTTTLRMIAGLELASEGRITIGGKDVTRVAAAARDVTMVFQSYALFPHLSVVENVSYGLVVERRPKDEVRDRSREALKLVGLSGFEDRQPSALSGGQQQRVAVARALVLEPSVLLFDEPLSNLDARLRRKMREDIRELQQKLGVTAVYVTHDQEEALSISDRIVVMDKGRIAQQGTPRELYELPGSSFVASFMGEANLAKGKLLSKNGDVGELAIGSLRMSISHRGAALGEVDLAIRPEALLIHSADHPTGMEATIAKATYLGDHMEYVLKTPIGELFASDHRGFRRFQAKDSVRITLADQGVALIV
jgi:iron(III) transport system ATP-binding protein